MQLPAKRNLASILGPNSFQSQPLGSIRFGFSEKTLFSPPNLMTEQLPAPKEENISSSISPKLRFLRGAPPKSTDLTRDKAMLGDTAALQLPNLDLSPGLHWRKQFQMNQVSNRQKWEVSHSPRTLSERAIAILNNHPEWQKDSQKEALEPQTTTNADILEKSSSPRSRSYQPSSKNPDIEPLPKIKSYVGHGKQIWGPKSTENSFENGSRAQFASHRDLKPKSFSQFSLRNLQLEPLEKIEKIYDDTLKLLTSSTTRNISQKSKMTKNVQLSPIKDEISNQMTPKSTSRISFRHLIFSPNVDKETLKKHLSQVHNGLIYSTQSLRGPTSKYLESRQISLGEPSSEQEATKKTLLLDLDETLIKHCPGEEDYDKLVYAKKDGQSFPIAFKIRPYAQQFIKKLKDYYEIMVFTASTQPYAEAIIREFDPEGHISYILDRSHCLETKNGYAIKDLRIIKNRELKNMVIVDNLVHSFGLQIENGIPILEWTGDKKDTELKFLMEYLVKASSAEDLREYNKENLKLRELSNASLPHIMARL